MNQYELARAREKALLERLAGLAVAGLPCPPLRTLSLDLGLSGNSSQPFAMMNRLAANGDIVLEQGGRWRVVFIPALGLRTGHPRSCTPEGKVKRPVAQIVATAAAVACLSIRDVTGSSREMLYLRPRHLAVWFCRAEGWSTTDIATGMRKRDHSTIVNSYQRAERLLEVDPLFQRLHRRMARIMQGDVEQPIVVPIRVPSRLRAPKIVLRKRWPGDETAERGHAIGSSQLLAALRRDHPEKCLA